jgi:hypothetical protein
VAYERGRGTRDERIEKIGKKGMNCLSLPKRKRVLFSLQTEMAQQKKKESSQKVFFSFYSLE